jgi:hypothetical protein
MMVRTGLSVPGDFLKLVSPIVATGLATAQTADRRMTTAADAAIRTVFMALLSFLRPGVCFARRAPGGLKRSHRAGFKTVDGFQDR